MDLLSLRYFRTVARHEHISRAADELRVAQPSVSRTIARLEAELGVPLFDRRGRRVHLNRYGRLFLRHVERALGELDDARRAVRDAAEADAGSVTVASEALVTLTYALARFRTAHPDVEVRLSQAGAEEMSRQLRAREVDFCVASQPLTGPSLQTLELLREEVLLALPPGHRLAGRDRVTVADVADEPFITTRPGLWPRALLDRLFTEAGLTPHITCESDEPSATGDLIGAGLGVGLVPAMSRASTLRATGAWVRLDAPGCERTLTLVWRADGYLSEAARKFKESITGTPLTSPEPAGPRPLRPD
ncbi:LysR family transcriptional regulator [Actinomycetota bacterium Odt1-20B]